MICRVLLIITYVNKVDINCISVSANKNNYAKVNLRVLYNLLVFPFY